MKKFALALLCIVSVAFFASCNKDDDEAGTPTINFVQGEGYISSDDTIEANTPFMVGIQAKSDESTKELLTDCHILITSGEEIWADTLISDINQEQYNIDFPLAFPTEGVFTITVTVRNTAENAAECSMTITSVVTDTPLTVTDITWVRKGGNCQSTEEMAQYGLIWEGRDAFHANIRPLNNDCKLYVFSDAAEAFDAITTDIEKAAFFTSLIEQGIPVEEYRNISVAVAGDTTYNDVLAVIDAEGNQHLILFVNANVQTGNFGVQTTITGQAK